MESSTTGQKPDNYRRPRRGDMLKKTVMTAVVAVVFVAGLWIGSERAAQGGPKGRVFELRTYTAAPGKLQALQTRFRDHAIRLFKKHGMESIGHWVPTDAPASQNTLIYIIAFPNREAAKKSWADFMKDPDWVKAKQESEVNGTLVEKVDSVFMEPTDYSRIK
jgi:hypothetical protein